MGMQWEEAHPMLQEMLHQSLMPGMVNHCAAISACEKEKQWELAHPFLQEMLHKSSMP